MFLKVKDKMKTTEIKGIHICGLKILIILTVINIFCVESQRKPLPGMIYILLWTSRYRQPFEFWKLMRKSFVAMNCEHQNCYITDKRDLFDDLTDFDAVLFNAINITGDIDFPPIRSDHQLYIFVSTESSANYRIDLNDYNYFFNYTWTYRLNSDITYPYFVVRNRRGKVIGPKKHVHWMNVTKMRPTSAAIKDRLKNKTIAAAWFVTNCAASNPRLHYAHNLNSALNDYNLYIDIYGGCGNKGCPRDQIDHCLGLVERDYYFYLSFENSYSEDYVTEKLMTALDHYAVPIVLGGADYSRFMPAGIYFDTKNCTERELATKMVELIKDKEKYYDMFRWRNYYSYHSIAESGETDPLCAFCAFLNDESKRGHRRTYARFTEWWNNLIEENDTIVNYERSGPKIKSYFSYKESSIIPKIEDKMPTYSILNSVNEFVDTLSRYFDLK